MLGSPNDPVARTTKTEAEERAAAAEPADTIREDVDTMVAQHSRTWVLQGWPGHPFAFLSALDAAITGTQALTIAGSGQVERGESWLDQAHKAAQRLYGEVNYAPENEEYANA